MKETRGDRKQKKKKVALTYSSILCNAHGKAKESSCH